jgi:uncharacterized protein (TIGR02598 family)
MAVAIAALGFITILGLLPQGITMARNTAEMSVGSRIIQRIAGELQSTPWEKITWNGYGPLRYFNSEGTEITAPTGGASSSADDEDLALSLAYVASVFVPDQALDVTLPAGAAASSSATSEPYLRRVKICVATTNNPSFDFSAATPRRYTSASALIAQISH